MTNIRIVRTVAGLKHIIRLLKSQGNSIGFVPTMGALHEGHASLLSQARNSCDVVVSSIYANPTQFDNKEDLAKYPRTEQEDLTLLQREKVDIAFIPQTDGIYHNTTVTPVDYGTLTNSLEGAHRPGHFNGMTTIVRRLFEIVSPNLAFFGEKDWQQLAIIKQMTASENLGIEIIGCPIVRESDGLALSSRNRRLSPNERKNALSISQAILGKTTDLKGSTKSIELEISNLLSQSNLKPDYVKIVDALSLEEIENLTLTKEKRILIAAYSGKIRLIDNAPI